MGVARDNLPRDGQTYGFMAAFAEVEVDLETGVWTIVDFTGVADVGTVIHPNSLGGQINGGSIQGIGHVRSQKLVYDPHYGARPLKRVIQKRLVDRLALAMLEGRFGEGDMVVVDAADGDLTFEKGTARPQTGERVPVGAA